MRKYLISIICLLLTIVSGCQFNESHEDNEALIINEIIEVDLVSSPNRVDGKIKLYQMNNYATPYLDFNQFLSNFSKMWGDYVKVDRDDTNIMITYKYHAEQEIYENEINIDFENSTLYLTNLSTIYAKQIEKPTPVEIDLKDYQLELYVDEQQKLMPLSLCNFFLSQATNASFLLAAETTLYNLSLYSPTVSDVYTEYEKNRPILTPQLQQESVHYLTFLMDNIYGLKDYQQVESYQEMIKDLFTSGDYNENLTRFIVGLDDGHSRIQLGTPELIELNKKYLQESQYQQKYTEAFEGNLCRELNEAIIDYREDIIYMDYRSFDTRDEMKYKNVLEESVGKTIIFDIRCNGGGLDNSMKDLLDFVSKDPLSIHYATTQGGQYSVTVDARYSNNNFILLTSPYSFSAANMFASYFKEFELGTIIGEKTGGGSACVRYFALPDGTVITLSVDLQLVNTEGELIEEGIEPDITLHFTPEMNLQETVLEIINQNSNTFHYKKYTFYYQIRKSILF